MLAFVHRHIFMNRPAHIYQHQKLSPVRLCSRLISVSFFTVFFPAYLSVVLAKKSEMKATVASYYKNTYQELVPTEQAGVCIQR